MSESQQKTWKWVARAIVLLSTLAGVLAAAQQLPAPVRDYSTLAVALLSAVSGWIFSFLPPKGAQ